MGLSPSKRAENVLKGSPAFRDAIITAYQECMDLTHHAFPGLRLYQLSHACSRVHALLVFEADDTAAKLQQKWLPQPPTQFQIDRTIRKEGLLSKSSINWEEFQSFALALFRDAVLDGSGRALARYIPLGFLAILCADMAAKRFPAYRTLDRVAPKAAASYAVATSAAIYYNLGG